MDVKIKEKLRLINCEGFKGIINRLTKEDIDMWEICKSGLLEKSF